jgi:hypothetical protein
MVKNENGEMEQLYMFTGADTVAGVVHARLAKAGKKVEHLGIIFALLVVYLVLIGYPYWFM